jgi:hypothetical protein
LSSLEQELGKLIPGLADSYIHHRLAQEWREMPIKPRHELPSPEDDPYAAYRDSDGWHGDEDVTLAKRDPGRPAHDALLHLYDELAEWWETLPKKLDGQTRFKWRPTFGKTEDNEQPEPTNLPAKLFLQIATAFDYKYTAANCNAVCLRVRDRRNLRVRGASNVRRARTYRARQAGKALLE